MTEFEYIVGLHTIVLGLATAKLLTSLSDTLKYRETIKSYWVHSLWCVIAQLNIIGYWYAIWRIQAESTEFGYAEFLAYFSVSVSLYLMSSFLSLDLGDDKNLGTPVKPRIAEQPSSRYMGEFRALCLQCHGRFE